MKQTDIVYKYRSWLNTFHRDTLYENELYLAAPKDFNDPFDCRIIPDLTTLDAPEKRKKYVDQLVIGSFEHITKSGQNIEKILDKFTQRLEEDLAGTNEFYRRIYYEQQDTCYGILSLTFKWNSILMWSHYAANHFGFCVGFDKKKLDDSGYFGKGGPVNYRDDFPQIDPFNTNLIEVGFIETHTKARKWKYENEYRLFHLDRNGLNADKRKIRVPDDVFKEIIIGLRFPKEDIEKIKRIADQKKIKIFQIIIKSKEFKLDKIEI